MGVLLQKVGLETQCMLFFFLEILIIFSVLLVCLFVSQHLLYEFATLLEIRKKQNKKTLDGLVDVRHLITEGFQSKIKFES